MKLFQKAYDFFRNIKTPTWLKILLGELQDLMIVVLQKAGKDYINFVTEQVIAAAQDNNMSSGEKFDYVFKQAKKHLTLCVFTLKDNEINCIIEFICSKLKGQKVIR
mgnify:CR=1 FL=1